MRYVRGQGVVSSKVWSGLVRALALTLSLVIALAALPLFATAHSAPLGNIQVSAAGDDRSSPDNPGKGDEHHSAYCSTGSGCACCFLPPEQIIDEHFAAAVESIAGFTIRLDPRPERLLRPPRSFSQT